MRWIAALLVILTPSLLPAPEVAQPRSSGGCNAAIAVTAGCVSNESTHLSITGTETRTPDRPRADDAPGAEPRTRESEPPCDPVRAASCNYTAVKVSNEAGQPLSITDVAQFAPQAASAVGEPGNIAVAGMPMNFVSAASAHTEAGTLLDRPISVRFTPARFVFDYGDGTGTTTSTGGRSWAALGQAAFTPTATSHTYRSRGTYAATVTVQYTAEVDIGGGWFRVPGELAINGQVQQIRVLEADTALVARTCIEQPGAPGC